MEIKFSSSPGPSSLVCMVAWLQGLKINNDDDIDNYDKDVSTF